MWKKLSLILMACTIALSFTAGGVADAKGSYKSSKKSYSPSTTTQTPNGGMNKTEPAAAKSPASSTNPAPTQQRGFFSGGGLMKGLMIGGLAGLLFGGLFGGMGFMGHLLGMLVNVFALVILFAVIRKIFVYFRDRKKFKPDSTPRQY
ncbi:hypothetical protein O9H85_11695 [Paenibacillus filicis]|uniref:Preprotein translocase subunit Tim44 n=1 Tax=Paenibacillus gyeongsangnamensis TaxID=3388067 RepID=A0ABT4Q8B7_9BACL|nr:hypothetical protein [Paenibacillus filicis]MCZ8513073.1 hypothetical protein [Paenibacillus filicis]